MKHIKSIFIATVAVLMAIVPSQNLSAHKYANRAERIVAQIHNPDTRQVLVISHRGDWRNWPENSLDAFDSAIKMGVDIIELDVHMTKDSVLVVCHDLTVDRTTNGKGKICDLTLAQIKQLRLKKGHGVTTDDTHMPTLEEALRLCKDRAVVNVDQGFSMYDDVLKVSEKVGSTEQILIKGTYSVDDVAATFAKHPRNMMYMPIVDFGKKTGWPLYNEYQQKKVVPLAYEVCWKEMTPEIEAAMKNIVAQGSKLWINSLWSSLNGGLDDDKAYYDQDAIYGKLIRMGATMLQTDRPEMMIRYLHKHHLHK
jgi:glycerophosphoryl diester phosphodiesterase